MAQLIATIIDVGWGDSIFIECRDDAGNEHYALIDSNDTTYYLSSFLFLKRYFEKKKINIKKNKPIFTYVFLSHAHSDHGSGLKRILREFGTKSFLYSKSANWSSMSDLIRYANRSKNVMHHQSIDSSKQLPPLGSVAVEILWPPHNYTDDRNENNNSLVLSFAVNNNDSFLFTGDAEDDVWHTIAASIPPTTKLFKVPHHGSVNGSFDTHGNSSWIDHCPAGAYLGISSHVKPFKHPDREVIDLFNQKNRDFFRTDKHYHLTFATDGTTTSVQYSHV
jgi:beta-lactamase superfamily II metal-dependent hydrolase